MPQDFGLLEAPSGNYELGEPTADLVQRIRGRFIVQFLSQRRSPRGSTLATEVKQGRVKTNADVVGRLSLTGSEIADLQARLSIEAQLTRVEILNVELLTDTVLRARLRLVTSEGTVEDTFTLGGEE